jgi:hypothetical protein
MMPPDPTPPVPPSDIPPSEPNATPIDTLNLTETLQDIVRWMARQKSVTLAEVSTYLHQEATAVQPLMDTLVQQGLVQALPPDQTSPDDTELIDPNLYHYQLQLGNKRGRQASSSIWNDLGA